ncbi:choice-of-anchor tandem repeat GloVer-containing protein [Chryseobacterium sp. JM1]|uniref:choice-of-anchor tandem repeat GloVer-containing protein n=1 Tax=Chryseobacterium sp. JM1 TaxID=1233950 RepID=UPI0004E6D8A7|nr:choice-of-anchor tandem repeat GloVer-containing protein [Chryseobacterium sp. JM1]KFF21639.1 hypothetical protein IW22_06750 [Chryseobacterium sp. JM1]
MNRIFILLLSVIAVNTFKSQDIKLLGTTLFGGANDHGVLYEYNVNNGTYTKKVEFNGLGNGQNPSGGVVQGPNGKIYGMTQTGGASNNGVIYQYDLVTNNYSKLYEFSNSMNGKIPYGSLTIAPNGKFYGVTQYGGTANKGTLFEFNPATNSYAKLRDFEGSFGVSPSGSLCLGSNGKLYGTTSSGGTRDEGIIYEYDIATTIFTVKHVMQSFYDGNYPTTLIETSPGVFRGTNRYSVNSQGTIFHYNANTNIFQKNYTFEYSIGSTPQEGLLKGNNGKLYGTTMYRGGFYNGVLFEFDPVSNQLSTLVNFQELPTGKTPFASPMQASNGKLYGTTFAGGANYNGTIYEYDISTGQYTKKYDFVGTSDGRNPYHGQLLQVNYSQLGTGSVRKENTPLYPNPTKGLLYLPEGAQNAAIISPEGRLILAVKDVKTIDISAFPKGIYLIEITFDTKEKITRKIIKE